MYAFSVLSSILSRWSLQKLKSIENLRIISAPGFTKYKQKCYFFSLTLSAYVCTGQIKVLLLPGFLSRTGMLCTRLLEKAKIIKIIY